MPSFQSSVVATVRQKIVTAARWGLAHEPQIHYGEIRPILEGVGRTLASEWAKDNAVRKVSIDFGVYGVPETFFIDRRGHIRAKHVGAVTDAVFRSKVESLLADPA